MCRDHLANLLLSLYETLEFGRLSLSLIVEACSMELGEEGKVALTQTAKRKEISIQALAKLMCADRCGNDVFAGPRGAGELETTQRGWRAFYSDRHPGN